MRLTYKGFVAEVLFSAHTDGFYGEVTNAIAVIAFQATELSDVKFAFQEAVNAYLGVASELPT